MGAKTAQGAAYRIVVPGRPVPKQRPRPGLNGWFFIPRRTMEYQELVGTYIRRVVKAPLAGEVAVKIRLYFRGGRIGDLDNYQKSLLDGANGIAFLDDRQICRIECERFTDDCERAEIEIEEVQEHGRKRT